MTIITQYVSNFDSTATDWTEVNSAPYLNNTDTDYVTTATKSQVESFFEFGSTGITTGTINSVVFYIETQQDTGGDDKITVNIQATGVTLTAVATYVPNVGSYSFQSTDISTILDTWAKINSAEISLTSVRTGTAMTAVYARRAYLYITYTAATPNPIGKKGSVFSLQSRNSKTRSRGQMGVVKLKRWV